MRRELAALATVVGGLLVGSPAHATTGSTPTIVDVKTPAPSVRTGSSLKFEVIAENQNKNASTPYALNFLLSATGNPSGARKVGEGAIPAIGSRTRKTFMFTTAIPTNATAGDFRLLLCHPRAGRPAYCHDDKAKVTITLAPAKLTLTPSTKNFGSITVGQDSPTSQFTVRNRGRRASDKVTISLSGTHRSSFAIVSTTCGKSLAPNATCTVKARFRPTATGLRTASLKATPAAKYATGAIVSLTGTGTPIPPASLTFSPANWDFGDVTLGETASKTITVANTGGSSSGNLSVAISSEPDHDFFTLLPASTCTGSPLAPGASCDLVVQFAPTSAGGARAYASSIISDTTPGTPPGGVTVPLTGTGKTTAHLEWSTPSTDFGNVYVLTTPTRSLTLTNTGDQTSGTPSLEVDTSTFDIESTTCTEPLAHNASCSVVVKLFPVYDSAHPELTGALKVEASPGTSGALSTELKATIVTSPASLQISMTPPTETVPGTYGTSASQLSNVVPDGAKAFRVWIKNAGAADAFVPNSVAFTRDSADAYVLNSTCNLHSGTAATTELLFTDPKIPAGSECSFELAVQGTGASTPTPTHYSVSFTINGDPGGAITGNVSSTF